MPEVCLGVVLIYSAGLLSVLHADGFYFIIQAPDKCSWNLLMLLWLLKGGSGNKFLKIYKKNLKQMVKCLRSLMNFKPKSEMFISTARNCCGSRANPGAGLADLYNREVFKLICLQIKRISLL